MNSFITGIVAAILMYFPLWLRLRKLERSERLRNTEFRMQIQRLDTRYDARDAALLQMISSKLKCSHDEQMAALDTRMAAIAESLAALEALIRTIQPKSI